MRSSGLILITFLCSSLYYNCLSDKTCSDEDKSCSTKALINSYFSVPDGIYVYSTTNKFQGNIATSYGSGDLRTGADNICKNDRLFSNLINQFCPEVRAIIPTDAVYLFDFTTMYGVSSSLPIYGPTGSLLSASWTSFVSGESQLNQTLASAGLGSDDFWTFSDTTGAVSASTCSIGTDAGSEFTGALGSAKGIAGDWLNPEGTNGFCDSYHRVLCICYNPVAIESPQ